jgi:UrcA family protein
MKKALSAIATSMLFASSLLAQSDKEGDVRFRYTLEETKTMEGATALLQRINSQAERQCRFIGGTTAPNPKAVQCAADLVKQFVASIDSPLLRRAARAETEMLAAETE